MPRPAGCAFSARAGFTRACDKLPKRFHAPLPEGPADGAHVDQAAWDAALDTYCRFCGWDPETGNPRPATRLRSTTRSCALPTTIPLSSPTATVS